jgi:hypothetical protein
MTDQHSDHGRKKHGEGCANHRRNPRISDALLHSIANRCRATAGNEGSSRMIGEKTEKHTDRHRQGADERHAKVELPPVECINVGKEGMRTGSGGGHLASILEYSRCVADSTIKWDECHLFTSPDRQ